MKGSGHYFLFPVKDGNSFSEFLQFRNFFSRETNILEKLLMQSMEVPASISLHNSVMCQIHKKAYKQIGIVIYVRQFATLAQKQLNMQSGIC